MTDHPRADESSVEDIRLDRKVAVVTGATGGWGSGAAFALARRGAAVVLNARTQSKLDALADRLTGLGAKAVGVAQDIRTLTGAEQLVHRAVEEYGRLDILMNSAGVTVTDVVPAAGDGGPLPMYGGSLNMTEADWTFVIDTELHAVFSCTKAAATQIVAQGDGGAIITVVGTIVGAAGQSAHAAAKRAVLNGIWSWSDELRPHAITVNGVRGYVRSLLTDRAFDVEAHEFAAASERDDLPTEPVEAGELVAWLASSDAADITGAYVGIDGPRVTIWEPKLPDTAVYRHPGWRAEEIGTRVGPLLRRRPPRPSMTDVVRDLLSAEDRAKVDATARSRRRATAASGAQS